VLAPFFSDGVGDKRRAEIGSFFLLASVFLYMVFPSRGCLSGSVVVDDLPPSDIERFSPLLLFEFPL